MRVASGTHWVKNARDAYVVLVGESVDEYWTLRNQDREVADYCERGNQET